MVTAINTQVNFTKGEIDERLYSRIDTDIYAKSVKRMRNALITPQGGVQRRFGTKYIAEAGDSDSRTFVIHITKGGNPSETILLEFILNQLKVYINDTLYTAFVTPYGSESLEILDGTQSTDDFVIVDGIHLPHRFYYKYIDGTDAYVFEEIDFIWQPTYNFNRNDNLYDTVTFTPSATSGTVTIVASDHVMDATMVGGLFYGGEGTLRITTYIDTLSVSGFTIEDFKNTTPIDGRNVVINTPVWAGDYWPSKVTFEQDRLCFANSGRLPNGVWCSKTGEYNNFDDSKSLDNFSIGFYINGEGNDAVNSLIGYKGLIIFTNNAIFTTSFVEGEPLTPSNISVNSEGEVGSAEFIRPIIYDNKIFFCGYGNNIIWSMQYDIQRRGYVYSDISILSPHLVKGVKRMSMYKNAADDIGSCLLVINEDNDCAILKSIESQNISGWSLCQTSGDFYDVAGYEDIVYFNTYRNTNYLIEKLDFSLFTDSAVAGTMASSDVITGLDHLNGLEVKVIGDGELLQERIVSGGHITIEKEVTTYEVGVGFEVLIIPLRVNIQTENGNLFYLPQRYKTIWVDYYKSLGIYINDFQIPSIASHILEDAETDVYEYSLMTGWYKKENKIAEDIKIQQNDPLPFFLKGIGLLIEVDNYV